METMGGWWQLKELPTLEQYENQAQIFEKLRVSRRSSDAIYVAMQNARELPMAEVKDLGNGLYCFETHFGGQVKRLRNTKNIKSGKFKKIEQKVALNQSA